MRRIYFKFSKRKKKNAKFPSTMSNCHIYTQSKCFLCHKSFFTGANFAFLSFCCSLRFYFSSSENNNRIIFIIWFLIWINLMRLWWVKRNRVCKLKSVFFLLFLPLNDRLLFAHKNSKENCSCANPEIKPQQRFGWTNWEDAPSTLTETR